MREGCTPARSGQAGGLIRLGFVCLHDAPQLPSEARPGKMLINIREAFLPKSSPNLLYGPARSRCRNLKSAFDDADLLHAETILGQNRFCKCCKPP